MKHWQEIVKEMWIKRGFKVVAFLTGKCMFGILIKNS